MGSVMSNDIRGMDLLLLFTEEYPCWNRETVECAGESFEDLLFLEESGLAASKDGIYQLTEAGRQRFREEAAASWYEAEPAGDVENPPRALRRNRLVRLLDRAFLGRWGLKKALPGKKLPLVGDLSREDMVAPEGKNLSWSFLEYPFVQAFTQKYPPGRVDTSPRNMEEFRAWRNSLGEREGIWELDLLMLHYCDFTEYMSYPAPKNDTLGAFLRGPSLLRLSSRRRRGGEHHIGDAGNSGEVVSLYARPAAALYALLLRCGSRGAELRKLVLLGGPHRRGGPFRCRGLEKLR